MCDNKLLQTLWKSREIILEVLKDRGFNIPSEDHLTLSEFGEWAGEDDEHTIKKSMNLYYEEEGKNIKVYWPTYPKLGTNIREIYKDMEESKVTRAIIVIDSTVTSQTKSTLNNLRKQNVYIDVYNIKETQFNIMKHILVPKHIIVCDKNKKDIMKSYAVNRDQLPHIYTSDPIVRHLGAIEGDLIKIKRKSDTMNDMFTISFRMVVPSKVK